MAASRDEWHKDSITLRERKAERAERRHHLQQVFKRHCTQQKKISKFKDGLYHKLPYQWAHNASFEFVPTLIDLADRLVSAAPRQTLICFYRKSSAEEEWFMCRQSIWTLGSRESIINLTEYQLLSQEVDGIQIIECPSVGDFEEALVADFLCFFKDSPFLPVVPISRYLKDPSQFRWDLQKIPADRCQFLQQELARALHDTEIRFWNSYASSDSAATELMFVSTNQICDSCSFVAFVMRNKVKISAKCCRPYPEWSNCWAKSRFVSSKFYLLIAP